MECTVLERAYTIFKLILIFHRPDLSPVSSKTGRDFAILKIAQQKTFIHSKSQKATVKPATCYAELFSKRNKSLKNQSLYPIYPQNQIPANIFQYLFKLRNFVSMALFKAKISSTKQAIYATHTNMPTCKTNYSPL